MIRPTLADHAGRPRWPYGPKRTLMKASPRGPFAVTTRPLAVRRSHLFDEALMVWQDNRPARLAARTKCGRFLLSVTSHMEPPESFEPCDDCLLAGSIPPCVYRLYDALGRLLYIGCTTNLPARISTHAGKNGSDWWPMVATFSYVEYADLAAAQAAEREAILAHRPVFNRDHTVRTKRRGLRPVGVLAAPPVLLVEAVTS